MKIGRGSTRLKLGLVMGVALLAFAALFVSSASAQGTVTGANATDLSGLPANAGGPFDPLSTNVPYLAWRGEEVRLVDCAPHFNATVEGTPVVTTNGFTFDGRLGGDRLKISMTLDEYSTQNSAGQLFAPQPIQTSPTKVYWADGRLCAAQTWYSAKAGIATFKMTAYIGDNNALLLQHDFMVGWMNIASTHITNPGTVGPEDPGISPGNSVNVRVTGSIPTGEFADEHGLPATLTMPNDWATWANHMATANMPQYGWLQFGNYSWGNGLDPYYQDSLTSPASFWDIHDSSGPLGVPDTADVHVNQGASPYGSCPGSTNDPLIDQVDNCNGGEGPFSRVFGDGTWSKGPFDPTDPGTLLSDGRLNANDAPMPAAEIVFNSTGGTVTTANGTFSGNMGGFVNSCLNDKDSVYNANFDPTNPTSSTDDTGGQDCIAVGKGENDPHALYAPYYDQYIPATSRDPFGSASGIDGPLAGNDNTQFFAGQYGSYSNWDIAQTLIQDTGLQSNCLLTGENNRYLNDGQTRVIEFTDEHGEARASWEPGIDANFFNAYANNNGEGGCDLAGVAFPNQTITASARYPEENVGSDVAAPESITKVIANHFAKTLSCVPKTGVGGTIVGYICTVTATDITGSGANFDGEHVCIQREPVGALFSVGGAGLPNGICGPLAQEVDLVSTNGGPATATFETLATLTGTNLDISANFVDEKIIRDLCFAVGSSGGSTAGESPCVAGSSTTTGTTTGSTTGTTGSTTGTTGSTTGTTGSTSGSVDTVGRKNAHKTAQVASVQFVTSRNGHRVLYVRVNSPRHMAKIHIALMHGNHVVKAAVRSIKANHRVAVKNLRISSQVTKAHVKVLH